jgi:hypothetical protein
MRNDDTSRGCPHASFSASSSWQQTGHLPFALRVSQRKISALLVALRVSSKNSHTLFVERARQYANSSIWCHGPVLDFPKPGRPARRLGAVTFRRTASMNARKLGRRFDRSRAHRSPPRPCARSTAAEMRAGRCLLLTANRGTMCIVRGG